MKRSQFMAVLVVLVSLAVPLLVVEMLFRLAPNLIERLNYKEGAAVDPQDMTAPHAKYGISGNAAYSGHDSRSWRNKSTLDRADIVALGDSQTYGLGAAMEFAWPQVVGKKLEQVVYQMAIGGAGPFNHALMINDALALKPSTIVATVYFGNDLIDSYRWAHGAVPYSYQLRSMPSEFESIVKAAPSSFLKEIAQAELVDPMLVRHSFLDCQSPRPLPDRELQSVGNVPQLPMLLPRAYTNSPFIRAMMEHSAAFRNLYVSLAPRPIWAYTDAPLYPEPVCFAFEKGEVSTILNPAFRMSAQDPTDARVQEGLRITLESFKYMRDRAASSGVNLFVLLIPTKELVFRKAILKSGVKSDSMENVWNAELVHRSTILNYLRASGIKSIDPLDALESEIDRGHNPYPMRNGKLNNDADGHPRAEGYKILADQVAAAIKLPTKQVP